MLSLKNLFNIFSTHAGCKIMFFYRGIMVCFNKTLSQRQRRADDLSDLSI